MTVRPTRQQGPVPLTALGLRCRARAKAEGPAPALAELRAGLGPDARAWGPGGHAVLPLAAAEAPGGAPVATLEFASGDLGVWRDARHRDGTTGPWAAGVLWIRLGLTEHLLRTAADYLAGRRVGGEVLAGIASVRTTLGEAAADLLEARLLLEHGPDDGGPATAEAAPPGESATGPDHRPASGPGAAEGAPGTAEAERTTASGASATGPGRKAVAGPRHHTVSGRAAGADAPEPPGPWAPADGPGALAASSAEGASRAAEALVRAQRAVLRLLGAAGYLDAGPGRLARAVDLLADVHPVAPEPAPCHHATEVSP
ncbi:hypothetical protein [Streptomyces sp. CMB-StM0423]|uniref:hypothetical protein n=1 Tax=Streptomyces sp. CMB-StM0423 TaxID=2059884 RepID=UPI001F3B569C|nr:hypothetical protein [Streptomyces sp. CMB-StM0423]